MTMMLALSKLPHAELWALLDLEPAGPVRVIARR